MGIIGGGLKKIGNTIHSKTSTAYKKHAPVFGDYFKDGWKSVKDSKFSEFSSDFKSGIGDVLKTAKEHTFNPINFGATNFSLGNFNISPTMQATGLTDIAEKIKNGGDVTKLIGNFQSKSETKANSNEKKAEDNKPSDSEMEEAIKNAPIKDKSILALAKSMIGVSLKTETDGAGSGIASKIFGEVKDMGLDPSLLLKKTTAYDEDIKKEDSGIFDFAFSSFKPNIPVHDLFNQLIHMDVDNLKLDDGGFASIFSEKEFDFKPTMSKFSESTADIEKSWREISLIGDIGAAVGTGGISAVPSLLRRVAEGNSFKATEGDFDTHFTNFNAYIPDLKDTEQTIGGDIFKEFEESKELKIGDFDISKGVNNFSNYNFVFDFNVDMNPIKDAGDEFDKDFDFEKLTKDFKINF